jgi:hypothetical protein
MDYKTKLLKLKESNTLLSQFYPEQIYSIKNFDLNITKINSIEKLPNISRENEGKFISDSLIFFDTSYCVNLLKDYKYKEFSIYLKSQLTSLLTFISKDRNSSLNNPLELVKYLFRIGKINYSSFSNFLSIFEIIFLYTESYYKITSRVNNSNGSTYEKSFVKLNYDPNIYEEQYFKFKEVLKIFSDLLSSIDSNKYKMTIEKIVQELDNI